ncbi:MAG TPA: HlyD family efflux transporter periplasmic adaptor subunit [Xanthobacteraceae bacterium]|jgi:multidrug resistance efflux pump
MKWSRIAALTAALSGAAAAPAQTPLTTQGRIESAGGTLRIGTAATGTIKQVLVHGWAHVRAGDLLVTVNCQPIEAEVEARTAQLSVAEAVFDRVWNGHRPAEITVGEAAVGYSKAKADEAQKTLDRTLTLHEGVSVTTARILEVQRDARISAAQLAEARAKLALLREGSREEEVREAYARWNNAVAELANARARLAQCSVRSPVDGVVADVLATPGQFLSLSVPTTLMHVIADGALVVRAEIDLRDMARICLDQSATVTAEATPDAAMHAKVTAISPALRPRSIAATGPDHGEEVQTVVLSLENNADALPIGMPVTVRFDPCQSRS